MTDDRLNLAIGRLEQAIAKLEQRLPAAIARPAAECSDTGDAALRQRHDALRARTSAAVERLSQLLDTAGEG